MARAPRRLHRGPRGRLRPLRGPRPATPVRAVRRAAVGAPHDEGPAGDGGRLAAASAPGPRGRGRHGFLELAALILREAEVTHGSGDLAGAESLGRQALAIAHAAAVGRPRGRGAPDHRAHPHRRRSGRRGPRPPRRGDALGGGGPARAPTRPARCTAASSAPARTSATSAEPPSGPTPRCAGPRSTRWRCGLASAACTTPPCCSYAVSSARPSVRLGRAASSSTASTSATWLPATWRSARSVGAWATSRGPWTAFARAEELCGQQPAGLALVRLAQRRIDDATAIITRLLAEQTWNRLARGKLLPARVQIAVAAGDFATASEAVDELDTLAADVRQPGAARGRRIGTWSTAPRPGRLERSVRLPARRLAALAGARGALRGRDGAPAARSGCRGCGDEEGAARSLASAAEIFDRLGATLDATQASELEQPVAGAAGRAHRP